MYRAVGSARFRVWVLRGFGFGDLGLRVEGLRFRVQSLEFKF